MENNITDTEKLKAEILMLKNRLEIQEKELKLHMKGTNQNGVLADNVKKVSNELCFADLKKMAVTAIVSISAGYISKKIVIGSTKNPVKILIGELFRIGITGMVAKMMNSAKQTE